MHDVEHFLVQRYPPPRPQLRVALVTETFPPEVNGVAMTVGRLVDGLRRRGHTLQLIRPRQHGGDQPVEAPDYREVLASGVGIPRYRGLRFGLPARTALRRLWTRERPDIVHVATEGPLGWSAVSAARSLKLPVSSGFHTNFDAYCRHYGMAWLRSPVAGYLRRLHNRTDATLVPARDIASKLMREGYRNITVMARGVDTALFNPARRNAELRARWGVGERDLVATCVGRLAPEKNLDLLLQTWTALRRQRPDARLLLVGDGPSRAELAAAHGEVIFAGMRHGEDLAAHYASADLFLFPSLTETYGNVIAEALASGLGVVAFDRAGAADLIEDGVSGRLAPGEDAAAFVGLALELANDPARLAAMRARAPAAVADFDWERIHDLFADTLLGLVHRHERKWHAVDVPFLAPD
jgi:glycosyltransferase involved in cell wall biosynthesis